MRKSRTDGLELLNEMIECSHTVHGGYLKDIPEPHIRRSEIPGFKRQVRISCSKFIMGSHYYVRIVEENDEIWNAKDKCWQHAWDDEVSKGRMFDQRYSHVRFVQPWIDRTLAQHFVPADKYEFDRSEVVSSVYGRDGD